MTSYVSPSTLYANPYANPPPSPSESAAFMQSLGVMMGVPQLPLLMRYAADDGEGPPYP